MYFEVSASLVSSVCDERQAVLQIFLLDMEGGCREQASGQKWHQDLQWSHRLDEGWDLSAVKQVIS